MVSRYVTELTLNKDEGSNNILYFNKTTDTYVPSVMYGRCISKNYWVPHFSIQVHLFLTYTSKKSTLSPSFFIISKKVTKVLVLGSIRLIIGIPCISTLINNDKNLPESFYEHNSIYEVIGFNRN